MAWSNELDPFSISANDLLYMPLSIKEKINAKKTIKGTFIYIFFFFVTPIHGCKVCI